MIDHTNPYIHEKVDAINLMETIRQLRTMISEEYSAANLYEQLAELVFDTDVAGVIFDIADEERTHAGEFEYLIQYLQEVYNVDCIPDDELKIKGKNEAEEKLNGMPVEQENLAPTDGDFSGL